MSEAVTVPRPMMMMTSTVYEESLARDTHARTHTRAHTHTHTQHTDTHTNKHTNTHTHTHTHNTHNTHTQILSKL